MRPWLTEPVPAAPASASAAAVAAAVAPKERLLNKRAMDWQSAYFMPAPADAAVIALRRWGCGALRGGGRGGEGRVARMLLRCGDPGRGERPCPHACALERLCFVFRTCRAPSSARGTAHVAGGSSTPRTQQRRACTVYVGTASPAPAPGPWPTPTTPQQTPGDTTSTAQTILTSVKPGP